jgi:hypothetical protein
MTITKCQLFNNKVHINFMVKSFLQKVGGYSFGQKSPSYYGNYCPSYISCYFIHYTCTQLKISEDVILPYQPNTTLINNNVHCHVLKNLPFLDIRLSFQVLQTPHKCSLQYSCRKHVSYFLSGILLCDDIVNKGHIILSTQLILVGTLTDYQLHSFQSMEIVL